MRRLVHFLLRVSLLFAALFLFCLRAPADTIVLKNGRRIVAMNVIEDGDKVRYLTSAGELSLPKSIVDHIEKNGFSPGGGGPTMAPSIADTSPSWKARRTAADRVQISTLPSHIMLLLCSRFRTATSSMR